MNASSANPSPAKGRLPLLLVAAVLVVCLVGVVLAGVSMGSGFSAVAYTVGDTKVSQRTVDADLRTLAEHNTFATQSIAANFRTTPGAVDATGAASWLTIEIYRTVGLDWLAKQGERITEAKRQAVLANLVSQSGPSFRTQLRTLPAALQRKILDVLVMQTDVQSTAFEGVRITVDPKYGHWSAKQRQVCPPTGCPSTTGASGTSG